MTIADAPGAAAVEQACYPQLSAADLLHEDEVPAHVELFPEGALTVADGNRVVGIALAWRRSFDLDHPEHTLADVCEPEHHEPAGAWFYGLSISVLPSHQNRGIGRRLYEIRKQTVRHLGLRGIVAGGMLPGLEASRLQPEDYVRAIESGTLTDPTLSFQLANGFRVRGLLPGYVSGGSHGGVATLLTWEPD